MTDEAARAASSRRSFIKQVGIAVFAAVPAIDALLRPGSAFAVNECQQVTCHQRSGNNGCCVGPYGGLIYDCYDNFFSHGYCYSECVYFTNWMCV